MSIKSSNGVGAAAQQGLVAYGWVISILTIWLFTATKF